MWNDYLDWEATHLATGAECGTESSSSFLLGERPLRFCKSAELFRAFSPLSANLTLELLLWSFFADFDLNRASGIRLLLWKHDMFKITFWAVKNRLNHISTLASLLLPSIVRRLWVRRFWAISCHEFDQKRAWPLGIVVLSTEIHPQFTLTPLFQHQTTELGIGFIPGRLRLEEVSEW